MADFSDLIKRLVPVPPISASGEQVAASEDFLGRPSAKEVPATSPAQTALEQPAIDPTYVAADMLTGGGASLSEGAAAALKGVARGFVNSTAFQAGSDQAARAAGSALPNHPYVQAAVGIAAPMLADIAARRAVANALPRRTPEGAILEGAPDDVTATVGGNPADKPEFQPQGAAALRQNIVDAVQGVQPTGGAIAEMVARFHGSRQPIEQLKDAAASAPNHALGRGFYTAGDEAIAGGYGSHVHRISESQPSKLLNVDEHLPPKVGEFLAGIAKDKFGVEIDPAKVDPHDFVYQAQKAGASTDDAWGAIREAAEPVGYNGLTAKAGKGSFLHPSDEPHQVNVYWRPESDLKLLGTAGARPTTRNLPRGTVDMSGMPEDAMPGAHIYQMPTKSIHLEPEKFQYKLNVDPHTGTTNALKDVGAWDPKSAGVLTLWKSPEGKFYVVNGHHRLELAKRLGVDNVAVQVLDSGSSVAGAIEHNVTPENARAYGAEINIKDGRGTAIDFAKYMRDTGRTPQQLAEGGLSMSESKARDAIALRGLSDHIFRDATLGRITENRAAIIGRELADNKPGQDAIYKTIHDLEEKGQDVSDKRLTELIRFAKAAGTSTETQTDLFGARQLEKSHAPQMADISAYVKDQLSKDKRLFGMAEKNKARLEAGNTQVDAATAASIAHGASVRQMMLEKGIYSSGTEANGIVRKYAALLANSPKTGRTQILQKAYHEVFDALDKDFKTAFPTGEIPAGIRPEDVPEQGNLLVGHSTPAEPSPAPVQPTILGARGPMPQAPPERPPMQTSMPGTEPPPANQQELEAAGQGSMFGGPTRRPLPGASTGGTEIGMSIVPGAPQFVQQDILPALKSSAAALKGTRDAIRRAFAPGSVSDVAEGGAATIARRSAELENAHTLAARALESDRRYMANMTKANTVDFIDKMERGQKQTTPELNIIADHLRTMLDDQRKAVQALGKGALEKFYENYFPHIWKDPEAAQANPLYARLMRMASGGPTGAAGSGIEGAGFGSRGSLEGSKSFLKHRTFEFFREGYDAGLDPVTWNPVEMALLKHYEMGKFIRGQQIFDDLKDQQWAKFVKAGAKAPPGWAKINDKIARVNQFVASEHGFIHRGDYYAPQEISRLIDHHLSPGMRSVTGESIANPYDALRAGSNLLNQLQLGLSAFHVATTTVNSGVSHLALAMDQAARGELRGASKQLVKSIPGVGLISDVMKGRKIYRQFYGLNDYGPRFQEAVDNYIKSGAHFDQSKPFIDNWTDSFMTSLRNGNPWGAMMRAPMAAVQQLSRPIFEYIVPRAKSAAFMELAQNELEKLPTGASDLDRLKVLSSVQNTIDNRFGELNYDKLFWNNKWKDFSFVLMRAPGWNIGTVRELGGGVLDAGQLAKGKLSPRTAYTLALPMWIATMGAVYQHAKTGEFPTLARDANGKIDVRQSIINFMAPKTGRTLQDGRPERVWFPGYHKDIWGIATKPGETIAHKLNPALSMLDDLYKNQDYFHTQIRDPDAPPLQQAEQVASYVAKGGEPFTVQNYLKRQEDTTSGKQGSPGLESALGVLPASRDVTNSRMMNFLDETLKGRSPEGAITSEQFTKNQTMRDIESQIRSGKSANIDQALRSGAIGPLDVRRALTKARTPYLQSRFSELPLPDAMKAYEMGEPDERRQVFPVIIEKMRRDLKSLPPNKIPQVVQQFQHILAEQTVAAHDAAAGR